MSQLRVVRPVFFFIVSLGLILAFSPKFIAYAQTPPDTGTLEFTANGEDFVRQGFTSKDGWAITFDQVLVNLTDITAYQTDPPFEPDETPFLPQSTVALTGSYVIDLAEGDEEAEPIFVAPAEAPAGQYNALSWNMIPATEGEMAGYSLWLAGTAEKDEQSLPFTIGVERGYSNLCGEFVGEARQGILQPGETAQLEMTFHFDHIFGDADLPAADELNVLAPGFEPFASVAEDGAVNTDLTALQESLSEEEYQMIVEILPSLGHTGEGHCEYTDLSPLQFTANGEDFIRQGFTSKDGWAITFDRALVNLTGITAYQTDPPYEPGGEFGFQAQTTASLTGTFVLDLAEGGESAEPIPVGETHAPVGQYNALSWQMVPAETGDMAGYSLWLEGTAEKDDQSLPFTIGVENSYTNLCGDFVGDERKGILQPGQPADLEMTFHFDHLFGDADLPEDDDLNVLAPGFEPFAALAEDGTIAADLATLAEVLPEDEYQMIVDILPTLGHTGEGHCEYSELGTLAITANGEDFIRQGFVSKDGWAVSFDQVWVNLTGITAYQTDPPYEPDQNELSPLVSAALPGSYMIDLAAGDETAPPILVDEMIVPVGQYNALGWQMVPAEEGDMAGYSLIMQGTAEKEGESLPFTIGVENSYSNLCGEFVGDERKGILQPSQAADLEMTFHFDHVFGDAELAEDDELNTMAPGFEPFASLAEDGVIETDLAALAEVLPEDEYQMLVDILPTLGHTGEGHCYYGE